MTPIRSSIGKTDGTLFDYAAASCPDQLVDHCQKTSSTGLKKGFPLVRRAFTHSLRSCSSSPLSSSAPPRLSMRKFLMYAAQSSGWLLACENTSPILPNSPNRDLHRLECRLKEIAGNPDEIKTFIDYAPDLDSCNLDSFREIFLLSSMAFWKIRRLRNRPQETSRNRL